MRIVPRHSLPSEKRSSSSPLAGHTRALFPGFTPVDGAMRAALLASVSGAFPSG